MRGAVLRETSGPVEIRELTCSPPGPGQLRIRLRAAGVCHSDLSLRDGTLPGAMPMIPGHEGAGEVVELGPDVQAPEVGTPVVLSWITSCGRCFFCLRGQTNLCVTGLAQPPASTFLPDGQPAHRALGVGVFAEETIVPAEAAVPVHDDVPLDIAALVGCGVLTGVGAVLNAARIEAGTAVVVIGCGGVGLNVVQAAHLAGASPIVAVDALEEKHETARHFGATHTATPEDLPDATAELTERRGFDCAFEVVGRSTTIHQAWDATRRGGTTVVVGAGAQDDHVHLSAGELYLSDKRLIGSLYGSGNIRTEIARMLRLWRAGRLDLRGLISQTITLDELGEAFTELEHGTPVRSLVTL